MPKSAKPLLVFVPGLGFRGEVYEPLLKHLRDRYEVRSANHPLKLPGRITWNFFDRVINQAAQGSEKFYLVGQSMGGPIALHYAASHQKKVINVVAIAPVMWPFKRQPRTFGRKVLNMMAAIRSGQVFHFLGTVPKYIGRRHPGVIRRLHDWAGTVNLTETFKKLRNATVIWHRHEEVIPQPHFEKLRKKHPNVDTVVVGGSHLSAVTEPKTIVTALREALDG